MNILITNHTGTQAHLGCHATTHALEQMLIRKLKPDNLWTDAWDARRPLRKAKSLLSLVTSSCMHFPFPSYKHFHQADLIVVNGEGMFYEQACSKPHSTPSQRLLEARLAKVMLGKRLWIVNHSLYSQSKEFDARILELYINADYIAVRESQTLHYLRKKGINRVHQAADAVFSLTLPPAAQRGTWNNKTFLTDSSAWPHRYLPNFHEKLKTFVEALRSQGLNPAYLSIRTDKRDAHIAEYLGLEYCSGSTVQDFLAHLQTAHLIISGRFHVNAFAILCGIPYLSFDANTYKNTALNEFINYPLPVFSFENYSLTDIMVLVGKASSEHYDLKNHLLAQREILRNLSEYNIPLHRS